MDSSNIASGGEAVLLNAGDWLSEKKYQYFPGPECKAKEGIIKGYKAPEGFPYPWDYEMVRETGNPHLPDALIIRDSFCDALLQFLAENFNHSVFIFDSWQYKANYDIVDKERPRVIIYEIIESNFDALLRFE
jgi:hypothetical protein